MADGAAPDTADVAAVPASLFGSDLVPAPSFPLRLLQALVLNALAASNAFFALLTAVFLPSMYCLACWMFA
eukprot:7416474-Pyramimonas_sp.AAC.1